MPANTRSHRLAALAAVSTLALLGAPGAWAVPPPISLQAIPPGRVGRVARLSGAVSQHAADAAQWSPATLNAPVTTGDAFWTEPRARADIQVASNRFTLAPSTELDMAALDDQAVTVSEPQGETFLVLRTVAAGDTYTVQTPRGTVQITAAGHYDIAAGDADHPTLVTVVDGAAQVTGNALSLQIGPHQTATVTGADALTGSVGPATEDAFLTAMLAEDRPTPRPAAPIPSVVAGMTGCEDLQSTGEWAATPQYGSVWYPPVQTDWVPYRHGRWTYVQPWGWTWVDEAPWGFAPFHYGRWAEIGGRWGWIPVLPGAEAEPAPGYRGPIYAPALVSFIGLGIAGAAAAGQVGWVPLGPREPYYPPYRANPAYIRGINATAVQNVAQSVTQTNITNNRTTIVQNYFNHAAATVVPAAAMARSAPIAGEARPLPPDQAARAQAQFQPPVRPSAATVGVTPAVARQFNFVPPRPAQPAPGPTIGASPIRVASPALPPGAPPNQPARPAEPQPEARPAPPATRVVPALPPTVLAPAAMPEPRPLPPRPQPPAAPRPAVRPPAFSPPPRPAAPAFRPPPPRPAPPPPHGGNGPHRH